MSIPQIWRDWKPKLLKLYEQCSSFVSSLARNSYHFLFVWRKDERFFINYLTTVQEIHQNGHRCTEFKQTSVPLAVLVWQILRFLQNWAKSDEDRAKITGHFDYLQIIQMSPVFNLSLSLFFCDTIFLMYVFYFAIANNLLVQELSKVMSEIHHYPSASLESIKETTIRVLNVYNHFNAILREYILFANLSRF